MPDLSPYNGKIIGDSNLIIEYFQKTLGIDLDKHLSKEEQAISLAFRRLIEENLYWVAIYYSYAIEENWQIYKTVMEKLFNQLPESTRYELFEELRDQILKECWGQGMSRHSEQEIFEIGEHDLSALSDFLGDKPFFMGTEPSTLDAVAYGFLARIIGDSLQTPVKIYALKLGNIKPFCERVRSKFYTEEETKLWQEK